jgi:hypothetical protein
MGVGPSILEFFNRSINLTIGGIAGRRMAELGDQKLWDLVATKPDGSRVWLKDWIEARGCHHYSIDIHGRNGSHPLDLSKPIVDPFWKSNFDIVTNFGTSEHVEDQGSCWDNIHGLGRPGSIYIHILPEFGKYPLTHCKYFYDKEFFENLVKVNRYTKILLESVTDIGHIGACYIKPKNTKFVFDANWVKRGDKKT